VGVDHFSFGFLACECWRYYSRLRGSIWHALSCDEEEISRFNFQRRVRYLDFVRWSARQIGVYMKKIPTLFERDWDGDRSRVLDKVHPGCEWVLAGEGVATRKLDGTGCMIRAKQLYKRRELRKGDKPPPLFEQADYDEETGKTVGWVPCDIGFDDRWHMEAFNKMDAKKDGTYELVGPKVQGNPEHWDQHQLLAHDPQALAFGEQPPRTFDGLRDWLAGKDVEGIVFHHPDGRMAKIKLRDFGHRRVRNPA
jgi:hypothetical protein